MTLSEALKELSKRTGLTYKKMAEKAGNSCTTALTTPISRNEMKVSSLIRMANAVGYDVLLVRRHALEYEDPIVIDEAGKKVEAAGGPNSEKTSDNRKEGN